MASAWSRPWGLRRRRYGRWWELDLHLHVNGDPSGSAGAAAASAGEQAGVPHSWGEGSPCCTHTRVCVCVRECARACASACVGPGQGEGGTDVRRVRKVRKGHLSLPQRPRTGPLNKGRRAWRTGGQAPPCLLLLLTLRPASQVSRLTRRRDARPGTG